METEVLLNKIKCVFDHVAPDEQAYLLAQIRTMMPANPQADIDWRVGWGYNTDDDTIVVNVALKITPAHQNIDSQSIDEVFAELLARTTQDKTKLNEGIEIMLNDCVPPHRLHTIAALYIDKDTAAVMFNLIGKPTEEAKKWGEDKRKHQAQYAA